MLGEAARTHADAARYATAYNDALDAHRRRGEGRLSLVAGDFGQTVGAPPALRVEPCRRGQGGDPAGAARAGAEGEPRPTCISRSMPRRPTGSSCRSTSSRRWSPTMPCSQTAGAGSGWRCRPIRSARCRCATGSIALARKHDRRLMVRLVKGAYWDSEIKAAQVAGLADYPVFTRKVATDVSPISPAPSGCSTRATPSIPPSPPTTPIRSAR